MSRRLASGGRIVRSQKLAFSFDGTTYRGYAGDTLASYGQTLLAAVGVDSQTIASTINAGKVVSGMLA